jgi:hypothetical protein
LAGSTSPEESVKRNARGTPDIRKRQLGAIAAILGGSGLKRKRSGKDEMQGGDKLKGQTTRDSEEPADVKHHKSRNLSSRSPERLREELSADEQVRYDRRRTIRRDQEHGFNRRHDDREVDLDKERDSRRRHISKLADAFDKERGRKGGHREERGASRYLDRERSPRRHRKDRSSSTDRDRDGRRVRRHRSRSRSPREKRTKNYRMRSSSSRRNRSTTPDGRREKSRRSRRSRSTERRRPAKPDTKKAPAEEEYDSDPLSSIIGPLPPKEPEIRTRGRGAFSRSAGIDSRFSADYDPTADVRLDPDEENDWDQALEALRDRAKWNQQGADRLKAAGFTDEEVRKWEKGGEKNEEDVRWSKKGESREWDKGKVLDGDGDISFEPVFGRLKDN